MAPHNIAYVHAGQRIPRARIYFYSHYSFFFRHYGVNSATHGAKNFVWATHLEPEKHKISNSLVAKALCCADGVFCTNSVLRNQLEHLGTPPELLHVAIGAADPERFVSHARVEQGKVGLCSAYYERKRPDFIFSIIKAMPWRNFILVGRNWHNFSDFESLCALDNFEYVEASYSDYPSLYDQMSVFLSVSKVEGGPIPLIEAMMSNVFPVVSDTGFARDVVQNGVNGFIFDESASALQVCELIDLAYDFHVDVRKTTADYSWDRFANGISREIFA